MLERNPSSPCYIPPHVRGLEKSILEMGVSARMSGPCKLAWGFSRSAPPKDSGVLSGNEIWTNLLKTHAILW